MNVVGVQCVPADGQVCVGRPSLREPQVLRVLGLTGNNRESRSREIRVQKQRGWCGLSWVLKGEGS